MRGPTLSGDSTSSYSAPPAFGRFQVLHQIGAGVLGPVFLARDVERKSFAVKVFRLDITPEQAAELAAQLTRLSRANLEHPSIVAPVAAGVEGTVAYLAQEYVGADSLDAAIRQYGPPPLPQALRILTGVAAALDFGAATGVYHGGLHPRDLLVTPEQVRVTGMGVGTALETIGLRSPVRRPYTAPERVQREAWDGRADVYSLGILSRELLIGGRRRSEAGEGRLSDERLARVETIVARATAARPAERFATALELVRELQEALAGATDVPSKPARGAERRPNGSRELLLPLDEEPAPAVETDAFPAAADSVSPVALHGRLSLGDEMEADDLGAGDMKGDLAPESRVTDLQFAGEDEFERAPIGGSGLDLSDLDTGLRADKAPVSDLGPIDDDTRFSEIEVEDEDEAPFSESLDVEPQAPAPGVETFDSVVIPAGRPVTGMDDEVRAVRSQPVDEPPAVRHSTGLLPFVAVFLMGILVGAIGGYWWGTRNVGEPSESPVTSERSSRLAASSPAQSPAGTAGAAPSSPSGSPAAAGAPPVAPPPAPAAPVETGRLVVRSTPRRAAVTVNGRSWGVTPLYLTRLAPGRYAVRVSRRGYTTQTREVTLSADQPESTLNFTLPRAGAAARTQKPGFFGSLSVDSLPAGSQVFLDGKLVGKTPCVVPNVPAGSHVVRVDRVGYRRWAQSVQVASGQRVRVAASLERESQ